ncbi:MAG: response regulator [Ignavibacteria bacterium]
MRTLIVEDDFISRLVLQKMLSQYGHCDIAVNGREAVTAFIFSLDREEYYDLICLDIMMPEMDGLDALKIIRKKEKEKQIPPQKEAKIIMTTALDTPRDVMEAFYEGGCSSYIVKPIERKKLLDIIKGFRLIE